MKKIRLKQGTLLWEKARATRIGSSEVFDIVRYYASDDELQNCGINAEDFKAEEPYTTAWSLYHKILNDSRHTRKAPDPEYAEYGHVVEPYGVCVLQKGRAKKLKPGEVYVNDNLIASLDISGVAEDVDVVPFSYGEGTPKIGQKFVCEQKTMLPIIVKNGVPYKYIIQAQYQIEMTKADFFILQIMVLRNDTPFIRGKVCQMSRKKRYQYLDENMDVKHIYFANNKHLAELIKTCMRRFFEDVENRKEPTPYIEYDSQRNIISSIHLNSGYNVDAEVEYDLSTYLHLKKLGEKIENKRRAELQKLVECAKSNNVCRFYCKDGTTGKFAKDGRFLIKAVGE